MTKTLVLTFDDAVQNHLSFVVPELIRRNFHATFFASHLATTVNGVSQQLTWSEVAKLNRAGFEVGNHTLTHPDMSQLSDEEIEREIMDLEEQLNDEGLPPSTVFAYPGGPVTEAVIPILKKHHFVAARSVGERAWEPAKDDPYHLPALTVHGETMEAFLHATSLADDAGTEVPILVYHGVPELCHPWVHTPQEVFLREMDYLKEHDFKVLALGEAVSLFV